MRHKGNSIGAGVLLPLLLLVGTLQAQPAIDPEADTLLRAMSDNLQGRTSAVFRVADTIDDVHDDGLKLQFAHVREVTVVRPDKLKMEITGDLTNRTLWKDGSTLTVLDRDENVYASIPAPGTIDETIDMLLEKYGMSVPAADLLSANPYDALTQGCDEVFYVGEGYVGEEVCHHLAFIAPDIEYQLWIAMGDKPAPRKMVITYKLLPGEPQYTQQLLGVGNADEIDEAVFASEIPEDAEQIDFHPVAMPE